MLCGWQNIKPEPTADGVPVAFLSTYILVHINDSVEIPAHTCTHVRSITVPHGRAKAGRGASAARWRAAGARPVSRQPRSPSHRGRSVGPPVGAAYLAAAPHVPVRQLVGQQGGGKEEEGFQGGSVRAWYMVVRAKRCQPQLSDSVDARRTEGTDGNRNKGKRKDNSVDNNKHPRVRGL